MTDEKIPATALNEDDCWAAVLRRDPAADDTFYYSVATTGVYCRPTCAARRPQRAHVRFHLTSAAAEAEGFRPCKRCRPNAPSLAAQHALAIENACRSLAAAGELPNLDALADAAQMSRFHFQRVFKSIAGVTPRAYFMQNRTRKVRAELTRSETVTEAIYNAGFNSNGRFYATSAQVLGMTPTAFRAGGAGESIRFTVGQCSLGGILVAATEKGICAILLGDDPDALLHDLEKRFPKARLIGADAQFEQWVAGVIAFVDAPAQTFDMPLDVRGTAFEQRVWQALRDIPPGSTSTYSSVAARIGQPKAARAVARACAANPVAIAIPCHRVVHKDNSLSGYRWGAERKRALLDREASV